MFTEAVDALLRDHCTPATVRTIEAGDAAGEAAARALWQTVADAGFLELLAPEADGGAGLPLPELYPVVAGLGRHAVPLPLAEAIAARALLAGRSQPMPAGLLTLAPAGRRAPGGGFTAPWVPHGRWADTVLAPDGDDVLLLDARSAERRPTGVRGSVTATLHWPAGTVATRVTGAGPALTAFGAALQAALLAGLMARVFEMTLGYCNERTQFGKTLAKFQAVQHQLAVMAEHTAAAGIAAEAAYQSTGATPAWLPAAIAKARTSEAAVLVANTTHALHGAIGITDDYDLQLFTRALHDGRRAHGSEAHWHALIGRAVLAAPAPLLDTVRNAAAALA